MSSLPQSLPLRLASRSSRPLTLGERLDRETLALGGGGLGLDNLQMSLPTSALLWFCNSVKAEKISLFSVWRRA